MQSPFAPAAGGVLSADIAVPEHERELAFYSSVLTTGPSPFWRDDLMNNQGTPIIGLGARIPEYEFLPLQWMPHFQVADVAASAASALERGGKELMHSRNDQGESEWAVFVDPGGAAFGLVPVVPADAAYTSGVARMGHIAGLTLPVPDPGSSRDFYQHVIGWEARATATSNHAGLPCEFEMLRSDGATSAQICQDQQRFTGVPAVWLMSLPVDDLSESLDRVRNGGGKVATASEENDTAVIQDPLGVWLMLQSGRERSINQNAVP